jgi:RNA polymerase sigma factor for flagellar operon FliA
MGVKARVATTTTLPERDRLVTEHIGLVRSMAQRLAQRLPAQFELDDLISVGIMGLMDAAGRYRASTGVPFDAFARRRIRGAMLDALRDLDWAPRSVRRLRRELDAGLSRARHNLRREPEPAEVAAELSMTVEQYEQALEQVRVLDFGSIRQLDSQRDGDPIVELFIDGGEAPDAKVARGELQAHLAAAIKQLPERERHILALCYEQELTLAEVGQVIGLCESRVSQLRSLALSRLRTLLRQSMAMPGGAA